MIDDITNMIDLLLFLSVWQAVFEDARTAAHFIGWPIDRSPSSSLDDRWKQTNFHAVVAPCACWACVPLFHSDSTMANSSEQ